MHASHAQLAARGKQAEKTHTCPQDGARSLRWDTSEEIQQDSL